MAGILAAIIICLPSFVSKWNQMSYMGQFYDFTIENPLLNEDSLQFMEQGILSFNAEKILNENEKSEEIIPMMFYHIKKKQTLENKELSRLYDADVYELKGNSDLLFPDETLLQREDKKGCLISQKAAWELYGNDEVIGASIVFNNASYTIRGVIKSKNSFFVCQQREGEKKILTKLRFKAGTFYKKEVQKEQIGNSFGLLLTDNLTKYQKYNITMDRLPNRMSDFEGWMEFFETLK